MRINVPSTEIKETEKAVYIYMNGTFYLKGDLIEYKPRAVAIARSNKGVWIEQQDGNVVLTDSYKIVAYLMRNEANVPYLVIEKENLDS